jgi:SAM-dependent methyltransferase
VVAKEVAVAETSAERLWVDREHLTTRAYGDSANLMARKAIYSYTSRPVDLTAWALEQVVIAPGSQVLDLGCGPGGYLRHLAGRASLRLIGIDLSAGMLADLCKAWEPGTPLPGLMVGDAQNIPLPDRSVDLALAMHMLYHVPDIARAARELRRVLRPGGTLLAVTNSREHLRQLIEVFDRALATFTGQEREYQPPLRRFRLEDGDEPLRQAFASVERRELIGELAIPEPGPALP